ncbi:MAG TPA: transcriptional regulator, partial [Candidatus Nitrosotenuis sp.]|nr:transcriptional regulator [Candidatus Nitrosotenuis sp.]
MEDLYEEAANNFLELSSQQRLQIIFRLLEKKSKITNMAKEIGATVQEV